jgi:peptidoglycan/LPS O-acetylase OafA/YrhL
MTQLDGLRAFAVGLVLVAHYAPKLPLPIGSGTGVRLFFVLSGFLITKNLLQMRGHGSFLDQLLDFYARRAVRIVPAYYAALTVGVVIAGLGAAEGLGWHLLFATNIQIALKGDWVGPFSPFWTLAVEQQFYLAWPFLVLTVSRPSMRQYMVCLVVFAWMFRACGIIVEASPLTFYMMPFYAIDALACGGLLALYVEHERARFGGRHWAVLR